MKLNFNQSALAFKYSVIALVLAMVFSYARVNDDGVTGWLTSAVGKVIEIIPKDKPTELEYRSAGIFDIYEDKLQLILLVACVSFAAAALIISYTSAKYEKSSLWYSAAIVTAGTALSSINVTAGIMAMVLTGVLVVRHKKGLMAET